MEILIGLGGFTGLAALIGAIWAVVKYYDKKKTAREDQLKAREQERDELLRQLSNKLETVITINNEQKEDIEELHRSNEAIQTTLTDVQRHAQDTRKTIDENEMDRLRGEIINCQNQLENGSGITQQMLQHVHHCYDKYHSKGGNSYIDSCMETITDYERECREAGIIGFE